jgi:hypothetical protein
MMTEKTRPSGAPALRSRRGDDALGPNSDIGAKLRALYGAVQDEAIPDKFLDLLEKLDQVETRQGSAQAGMRSKG